MKDILLFTLITIIGFLMLTILVIIWQGIINLVDRFEMHLKTIIAFLFFGATGIAGCYLIGLATIEVYHRLFVW